MAKLYFEKVKKVRKVAKFFGRGYKGIMRKRPLGIYLNILFSIFVGAFAIILYQDPSNSIILRYFGYLIIFLSLLLFTMKKWTRLAIATLSALFCLFYISGFVFTLFHLNDGAAMGLSAFFPIFIYSAILAIYLLRPAAKQSFN